jgi:NADH:ubiquinone oxidoreductase subunit 6 (subunit J)
VKVQCPTPSGVIENAPFEGSCVSLAMVLHESGLPAAGVVNVKAFAFPVWVTFTFIANALPTPSNETLDGFSTTLPGAAAVGVGVGLGAIVGPVLIGATGGVEFALQPARAANVQ